MSTENDVPLGEGSRRYYEQMFGDRIRQVSKSGTAPSRNRPSSGSPGRAGCGVLIAIFIAIRFIAAFMGSHSNHTTNNPPPPPRFNAAPFPDNRVPDDDALERLRQLMQKQKLNHIEPKRPLHEVEQNFLLTKDDVPFLEGLCYRLYHESLRKEATPGKHFLALMDADVRALVAKAGRGIALDENESAEVLKGLNEILEHRDFWNYESLARLRELQETSRQHDNAQGLHIPPPARMEERRLILQICYPRQIVPLSERNHFGEKARETLREQARMDLGKARRQYEGIKP